MNKTDICQGCDLFENKVCKKWIGQPLDPSTKDWLSGIEEFDGEFVSVNRMCRYSSTFGNLYVCLTQEDIDRLKNGEIIHIEDEYGLFIGFQEEQT